MLWNVEGADSKTGQDQVLRIEAASEKEAATLARKRGLFVSQVKPASVSKGRPATVSEVKPDNVRGVNPKPSGLLLKILFASAFVVVVVTGGVLWKLFGNKSSSVSDSAPPMSTVGAAHPTTSVAPSPSANQSAGLEAQNAELAKKVAELSDKLAKASVPPVAQEVDRPDPDAFKRFAEKFAQAITAEEKAKPKTQDQPGEKTDDLHTYRVASTDIRRTDSLVDPLVGIIELNEFEISSTKRTDDNSLVFDFQISAHHVITLSFQKNGIWIPIKDVRRVESESQFPEGLSPVVAVGDESTNDCKWAAGAANKAQLSDK